MPTVLITGSSGFVGSQAHAAFTSAGWRVVGVGRRPMSQVGYLQADLSRPLTQPLLTAIREADVVLHAAARSSPWGRRRQFEAANVHATRQLLAACNGVAKFIFISSSSVYYQPQDQLGITESTPVAPTPVNHYAATKQQAESLVREYPGRWVILRPRAVYGRGDTVLFPRIMAAAKAGRLPMLVRAGTPVVGDLISIDNLSSCLRCAAESEDIHGEYNLTDSQPQQINAFLLDIFRRLELPAPRRTVSVRAAHRVAWALECFYGALMPWREPPITRFGVHVFAYSKTFDVAKMLRDFGPPQQSTEEAVEEFVAWVRQDDPYQLRDDA